MCSLVWKFSSSLASECPFTPTGKLRDHYICTVTLTYCNLSEDVTWQENQMGCGFYSRLSWFSLHVRHWQTWEWKYYSSKSKKMFYLKSFIGTTSFAIICSRSTAKYLLSLFILTTQNEFICVTVCCRGAGCALWHLLKQSQVKNCVSFAGYFVIRCGIRSTAFIFSLFLVCDMNSSESCCLSLNCRNVWSQTAQSPGPSWDLLVHWNDSFNVGILSTAAHSEANS